MSALFETVSPNLWEKQRKELLKDSRVRFWYFVEKLKGAFSRLFRGT